MKIKRKQLICVKCKKEWYPRTDDVRQCPRCKTAYWDKGKNV